MLQSLLPSQSKHHRPAVLDRYNVINAARKLRAASVIPPLPPPTGMAALLPWQYLPKSISKLWEPPAIQRLYEFCFRAPAEEHQKIYNLELELARAIRIPEKD